MTFPLVINIDGRGKVPTCLVDNQPISFTFNAVSTSPQRRDPPHRFHVDDKSKITKWDGMWDPNEPSMVSCIQALQKEL